MSSTGENHRYSFSIILENGEFRAASDDDWNAIPCMEFINHKLEVLQLIHVKFYIAEDEFTLGLAMDTGDTYLNGEPMITKSGNNAHFNKFSRSKNPSLSLNNIAYAYHSQIAPLAYIIDSSVIINVLSRIYKQLAIFLKPPLTQEYINSFNALAR